MQTEVSNVPQVRVKHEKTWKILTIVFAILTILGCIGTVFYYRESTRLAEENTSLKAEQDAKDNSAGQSNPSDFVASNIVFSDTDYHLQLSNGHINATVSNVERTSIQLSLDRETMSSWYNLDYDEDEDWINFEVTFDKPVGDIFFGGFGQAAGEEALLFLLDDGTVEFLPLFSAARDENASSKQKIAGLYHIVKFYLAGKDGVYIFAQSQDGTLYNLYDYIESTLRAQYE